ncbi:MarR family transcriptional regulator [Patulibacter sp.]|uniref:MarR family transcriptional regulator n=1 Tax=Patulibacter sp. TaxID=1912859 RepID=UPI0027274620|nr:MarR family transcriptional regulator [Patulibacter sp.]MDO9409960.1 MarR family transcriptional regulator [Patulibacter sp.]
MPDPAEPIDRTALLYLLRRQSEEAIRFAAVFGETHGLHQTDVSALAAIAHGAASGTPLGPAALASTLHLSRPATTALLDRLERAGHVARRPDPDDRRRSVIEMQPAASALAGEFFGPLGAAFGRAIERYTPEQLEVVAAFLRDVTDATISTREALTPRP